MKRMKCLNSNIRTKIKLHSAAFFISLLLLINSVSGQTLVPYKNLSSAAIGKSIGDGIAKSLNSLKDLRKENRDFGEQLNELRESYWKLYASEDLYKPFENFKEPKEIEDKYLDLLQQKDIYYLMLDYYNYLKSNSNGQSTLGGLGDVVDLLAGPIDGGINKEALDKYEVWSTQVFRTWSKSATSVFDSNAFSRAYNDNMDLYLLYVEERNSSEYYFKNPYSPLKSNNIESFFISKSILYDLYANEEQIIEDFKFISSKVEKGILSYEFEKVIHSTTKNNDDQLKEFEWAIANSSKDLLGIYTIKRKFKMRWVEAEKIFNNRIKRYGRENVNNILDDLWLNRDNKNSKCPTNPFYLINAQLKYNFIFNRNEDCFAKGLGENTIWYDLIDLSANNLNIPKLQAEAKNLIFNGANLNEMEIDELYLDLINLINEKLLLTSIFIEKNYGKELYLSDYPTDLHLEKDNLSRYPKDLFLMLLEGLAIAEQDCHTIALLYGVYKTKGELFTKINAAKIDLERLIEENKLNCELVLESSRFYNMDSSPLNFCVRHSQSFLYEKLCEVKLFNEEKVESSFSENNNYSQFDTNNQFNDYQIYNSSQVYGVPNWPKCVGINRGYYQKQCVEEEIKKLVNLKFNQILESLDFKIESSEEIYSTVIIEPDGSYTPSHINSSVKEIISAFENSFEELPKYGSYTNNGENVRVKIGVYLSIK